MTSSRSGAHGSSKLPHSSLAGLPGGYDTDISQIFNGSDGRRGREKLLPGSLQI